MTFALPTHLTVGPFLAPVFAAGAVWIAGTRLGRARARELAVSMHGDHAVGFDTVPASPARVRIRAALGKPEARTVAVLLACSGALAVATRSVVPLVLALPASVYLARRRAQAEALRAAIELRSGVAELASAMVGELRAGQPPSEAFTATVQSLTGAIRTHLAEAVAIARVGGDIPETLVRAAQAPGADALVRIAACWRVAAERGAGFAPALDRVAAGLRAEESGHRELEAELSGARTTARLLAALPAVGILLGQGVGADPLDVLLHTPLGIACLVLGLVLIALGLNWTDRIARDVRGPRWTA